ncbi:MAG: hypothetical protein PUF04_09470 [bacterium]|nr:hypothetical protein [bacterium]
MSEANLDGFDVHVLASEVDDDTIVVTADERFEAHAEKALTSALQKYDENKRLYGVKFAESSSGDTLTVERIDELVTGINTNLANVLNLNRYVRAYILKDDILGSTYSAIQSNTNSEYRLMYTHAEGRNKIKALNVAKEAIEQFNRRVHLRRLISESILQTFTEGNFVMYLRMEDGNAVIDTYPLGIAEITEYTVNGNPIVQINLTEFKNRLRKTYSKTKKGTALYFENLDAEVRASFPKEVYDAYKAGENYARLEVLNTGVLRINHFGSRYGVSHFARALRPAVVLENIENADIINNKAKAKKIIFQKLRREIMGPNQDYQRKGFEYAAHAHNELVSAWGNTTVLYTAIPAVEDLTFVEPTAEGTPSEKIALYRNEKMTALGVSYIDPNLGSVSLANISLSQLMKTIDVIADQLSEILHRFYRQYLIHLNIDAAYAPEIDVLDSAQMEMDVKRQLAELMFSKLNLSYASTLEVLGMNAAHEAARRVEENAAGFDEIFTPHASQYTTSSNEGGRPTGSNDPDKQLYDQQNRQTQ